MYIHLIWPHLDPLEGIQYLSSWIKAQTCNSRHVNVWCQLVIDCNKMKQIIDFFARGFYDWLSYNLWVHRLIAILFELFRCKKFHSLLPRKNVLKNVEVDIIPIPALSFGHLQTSSRALTRVRMQPALSYMCSTHYAVCWESISWNTLTNIQRKKDVIKFPCSSRRSRVTRI